MDLMNNMSFEMTKSFIPNISKSDTLKIVELTRDGVVIQMENSSCRGVFPLDSFQYWIKKGSLIHLDEQQKSS